MHVVYAFAIGAVHILFLKPATAAGLVFHHFAPHGVEEAGGSRPLVQREGHGEDLVSEDVLDLLHDTGDVGVLLVDAVEDDELGDSQAVGLGPHALRNEAHTRNCVDYDEGEIGNGQGAERIADEIGRTGGVDHVEFHTQPLHAQERGVNRDLVLALIRVIVGNGISVCDRAHALDVSGVGQHRLTERGLPC